MGFFRPLVSFVREEDIISNLSFIFYFFRSFVRSFFLSFFLSLSLSLSCLSSPHRCASFGHCSLDFFGPVYHSGSGEVGETSIFPGWAR